MTSPSLTFQRAALSLLIGSCVLLLSACGDKKSKPDTTTAAAAIDPMEVAIKPEMAAQFKISPLAMQDITPWLEISGRIEANDRLVTRIGAAVTGRVTEVLAEVGDRVQLGQALARVASSELTTAQMGYLKAHSAASQAERAVERARQLILADVIGSAELQRRESELAIARAEFRAAGDQLRLMGLPTAAIERLKDQGTLHPVASVSATLAGVVIERKISQGQVAQPGDPLFTVADLSSVWVIGNLPEQDAGSVSMHQQVEVEVPALGDKHLKGKIIFISDTVSPDTRTIAIRTEVSNQKFELKPQMLATLVISNKLTRQLAVPTSAVVRENDKDHVFIKLEENKYRLVPVELENDAGDFRRVKKGLSEGSEVVVAGAFHLNNERRRAELK